MKTHHWMAKAIVVAGLIGAGVARAGDLTPPGAPSPTMHTLEEIYQRLNTLEENQAVIEGKLTSGGMHQMSGNMALIPAGSFVMGGTTNVGHNESQNDEKPQHTVNVSAFYMDKYEVTSNLWREVYMWATNKGYVFAHVGEGKDWAHPVHTVSWYDAIAWCNARSARDGFTPCYTNANGTVYTNASGNSFAGDCNWAASGYRLPTEAEWEKAARGGVADRRFPWDDMNTIQHARANYVADPVSFAFDTSSTTGSHPWYNNNPTPYTSPTGSFAPNGYGLYDMAGNVGEWCWDWHDASYYSGSPGTNPRGPSSGYGREIRGGAWSVYANDARVAKRNAMTANAVNSAIGFRCVRGI